MFIFLIILFIAYWTFYIVYLETKSPGAFKRSWHDAEWGKPLGASKYKSKK